MEQRTRNLRTATLIGVILLLGVPAAAVEPVSVLLKGHDEPIEGYLREVSHSRYLLQGENVYYSFPADQIVTVDGKKSFPESVRGSGRLIYSTLYEKLLPNGDVEIWLRNEVENDSAIHLKGTDWGAAAWEKDELETLEVYDNFANRLPVKIIPRGDGGFRVEVDFLVPVAPGESLGLSVRKVRRAAAKLADGEWSYTFMLGFPEDRYLTRKIELPHGAELLDHYTGCWRFNIEDRLLLISQHYYPADTSQPLIVTWKMP